MTPTGSETSAAVPRARSGGSPSFAELLRASSVGASEARTSLAAAGDKVRARMRQHVAMHHHAPPPPSMGDLADRWQEATERDGVLALLPPRRPVPATEDAPVAAPTTMKRPSRAGDLATASANGNSVPTHHQDGAMTVTAPEAAHPTAETAGWRSWHLWPSVDLVGAEQPGPTPWRRPFGGPDTCTVEPDLVLLIGDQVLVIEVKSRATRRAGLFLPAGNGRTLVCVAFTLLLHDRRSGAYIGPAHDPLLRSEALPSWPPLLSAEACPGSRGPTHLWPGRRTIPRPPLDAAGGKGTALLTERIRSELRDLRSRVPRVQGALDLPCLANRVARTGVPPLDVLCQRRGRCNRGSFPAADESEFLGGCHGGFQDLRANLAVEPELSQDHQIHQSINQAHTDKCKDPHTPQPNGAAPFRDRDASHSRLLVPGPPGIGKTQLVAELISDHMVHAGVLMVASPTAALPSTSVFRHGDGGRLVQGPSASTPTSVVMWHSKVDRQNIDTPVVGARW